MLRALPAPSDHKEQTVAQLTDGTQPHEPTLTMTRREAAREAGLSINALDAALQRGDFPSLKVGTRRLIPRAAFRRLLNGGD